MPTSEREAFKADRTCSEQPWEGSASGQYQMGVRTGHKSKWRNDTSDCAGPLTFVLYFIGLARNLRTILNKGKNRSP